MSDLADQVMTIISDKLQVEREKIHLETSLQGDLNADSLDIVEIMMSIEDSFKVTIPDEEAEKMKTVGDVVKFIEANQK